MRTSLILIVTCAALSLAAAVRLALHDQPPAVGHAPVPLDCADGDVSNRVHLNVRLGWLANANSAGQLVALARGFYREERIDVTFHEGGLTDPSVKTVAAGVDDIGFANAPELVIAARAAGAPLKIVATIHRDGLHTFMVREDSGINTLEEWRGRRIGIKPGSPTYLQYRVLLARAGLSTSDVTEVPLKYDLQPFLNAEIDVYPGSLTNEAISLELQGIRLRYFTPADYGLPTMGHVIFTTDANIESRRDVVCRFVRATMRGWEWCKVQENRATAVDYLMAYNPQLDRAKERRALEAVISTVGDGSVDLARLGAIIQSQYDYASLQRAPSLNELVASLSP